MTRIKISDDALQDLDEGFEFYEAQEAGIGDYFVACLRGDIERLKITAGTHRIVYLDYHHYVSQRFPFGIYYTFDDQEDTAVVWAVIDLRKDPIWIEDRLQR